jgi:hypothetical protein
VKKCFICLFAAVFVFAAMTCFAGDISSKMTSSSTTATQSDTVKVDMSGSGCPMMKAQQVDAKGKAAACPMMKSAKAGDPTSSSSACPMMKGKVDASAAATSAVAGDVKAADPHANCAAMGKAAAQQTTGAEINLQEKGKGATVSEVSVEGVTAVGASQISATGKVTEAICPDVTGKAQLENFHNALEPMHQALNEKNYDAMRSSMPTLEEAASGLKAAQCPMGDKCPPDCKKNFEAKRANLLKTVDDVNVASKGTDNAKLENAFNAMHTAYIEFASSCNMPNATKATATETAKEIGTK